MRRQILLTHASFAAISVFALSGAAHAQTAPNPVTSSDVAACSKLPTPAEQTLCLQGQAQPEGTIEEAGDKATLAPTVATAQQADSDTVVVTGSRIRRSPFTSPDPITIISPDLELKSGRNDTGEILQTTPAAAGSFQITSLISAGSFVTNGGVGAQTLSLRGLGAERTLVLVNGRRAGPSGTRGAIAGFDLNVIPSSLINSVEILKTGASSIYGSDAIAGVVNLLTRKSTDGLDVRGFASVPFQGGGENYNASVAYGKEFSRGHLIGGLDVYRRNDLRRNQRDYLLCAEEYVFNTSGDRVDVLDPRTGQPRCNTLQAGYIGVTTQTLSPGVTFGTIQFNNPGDRLNDFIPPIVNRPTFGVPAGFFPVAVTCSTVNPAAIPSFPLCRNSLALLNQNLPLVGEADVIPELNRYTAYLDGGFNLTDNVELVGEFLYNKRKTRTDGVRQLFFSQFTGSTTLPATQCTPGRIALNPNCSRTGTGDPLNVGFNGNVFLQPVVPVATLVKTEVDYFRGVGGIKADLPGFMDGWKFDSYVQYSNSNGKYTNSRIFQDAIDLQAFRSRRCQPGQVTSIRGVPCMDINFTDPRVIAGNFTPEERAFLFGEETGKTKYTQLTAEASLAGNLFTLPAGPVGVALGVQWRRDEIDDTPGEIALSRNVFGQSVAGRTAGLTRSKEAFGEIELPLIHNTPLIQNLTLSAAARVTSNYAERDIDGVNDSDNGNWTYKIGGNWQVNDWLRFRATYGTSFRAPALFEQFLADQTGFLGQTAIDPCINFGQAVDSGALSARIGERCAALGISPTYNGGGTSSAVVATGGGIGVLESETSKAKTFSVVLTPDRGLWNGMKMSLAVDYFDINVTGQITTLGAGNIVFSCFDSDTYPDDPTCGLFVRQTDPTQTRFGEITSVRDPFININRQRNRGVDVTGRITQDLGRFGKLSALAQMTWQIEDLFELFQGSTDTTEGEIGEPTWVGDFKFTWDKGPWSVFYGLNVVGGVSNEQTLRDQRGGDVCFNSPIRGGLICPIYKLDAQFLHSASVTREIGDKFTMTAGVSNLFDTKPPRVSGSFGPVSTLGQIPIFATQYDQIGRRAFVSVRVKM